MATATPPYDGKPCPFCSIEVRNLYAVAHNYANGSGDTTIEDLRRAVKACEPLSELHFADRHHSHGYIGG